MVFTNSNKFYIGSGVFISAVLNDFASYSLTINGVDNNPELTGADVYPNPFNSVLKINLKKPKQYTEAKIYNSKGQLVKNQTLTNAENIIELS